MHGRFPVAALLGALAALAALFPAAAQAATWAGSWDTDYGRMELSQSGSRVTGTYEYCSGRISGTVSGATLSGTWEQEVGCGNASADEAIGPLEFELSTDGASFSGNWGYADPSDPSALPDYWESEWKGTRAVADAPAPPRSSAPPPGTVPRGTGGSPTSRPVSAGGKHVLPLDRVARLNAALSYAAPSKGRAITISAPAVPAIAAALTVRIGFTDRYGKRIAGVPAVAVGERATRLDRLTAWRSLAAARCYSLGRYALFSGDLLWTTRRRAAHPKLRATCKRDARGITLTLRPRKAGGLRAVLGRRPTISVGRTSAGAAPKAGDRLSVRWSVS